MFASSARSRTLSALSLFVTLAASSAASARDTSNDEQVRAIVAAATADLDRSGKVAGLFGQAFAGAIGLGDTPNGRFTAVVNGKNARVEAVNGEGKTQVVLEVEQGRGLFGALFGVRKVKAASLATATNTPEQGQPVHTAVAQTVTLTSIRLLPGVRLSYLKNANQTTQKEEPARSSEAMLRVMLSQAGPRVTGLTVLKVGHNYGIKVGKLTGWMSRQTGRAERTTTH
ncbi:MAG: hypothetical protein IT371_26585 [Deltaproteobacteria bacterium]|nr:hypothetical protein [Deltaproteobacteria bacterium]